MTAPLTLSAARTLALRAQGLATPNGAEPDPTLDAIYDMVDRLTCIQIDTLHMVQRAQYVTLWSRFGRYDPADFDRLVYDPGQRRLFEYWQHAASIIPLAEYRYRQPTMQYYRDGGGWWPKWGEKPTNRAVIDEV
ncbi:MAG: winged helix DNA-binding domain-containing protein, partial [Anaerolineae bacterium]|nr:winged helix DNA-binding domain-containing protein [Anaerolineae bacterium]